MKFTINSIPDYSRYYGNYRLAAREFSEYENVAGFLLTELNSSNTVTAKFCTCVNPKTYEVGGREIALTIESDTARIWYDGLSSEFTVSDFTNADAGFGYYKITDTVSGDVWYSDLIYVSEVLYPSGIESFTFFVFVLLENTTGTGLNVAVGVSDRNIIINGNSFTTDNTGRVTITTPSLSEYNYVVQSGTKTIEFNSVSYDAEWNEISGVVNLDDSPPTVSGDSSNRSRFGNDIYTLLIQVDEFDRLA